MLDPTSDQNLPLPQAPVAAPVPPANPLPITEPVSSNPVSPAMTPSVPAPTASAATPASPASAANPAAAQTKMIGKYKVEVINEKCIGAASCVAIASQVFQLTEQNIAAVISQDGADDDTKLLAAQSCPTSAIVVTDTETGQKVWPLD